MLHTVLNLTRPLVIFDLETTGVRVDSARIVEMAFRIYTAEGTTKHWRSLVNPGIPIPPETTETHHIKDSDMVGCRLCGQHSSSHPVPDSEGGGAGNACPEFKPIPFFKDIAETIAKGFSNCDFGGKNIRFDLQVLDAEMRRNRQPWSYEGAAVLCADRFEQIGEPRSLSALYKKHTGKDLVGAHSALVDVDASIEVMVQQLTKYATALPRNLRSLHELQWPGWIDAEGKFRFKGNEPVITFGKHNGTPMRQVPRSYWTWIAGNDFSPEIKRIAEEAAKGNFPQKG